VQTERIGHQAQLLRYAINSKSVKARKREGANQVDLADRVGVSRSTVQRLERGDDVSVDSLLSTLAELGLEAILVPRGARVTVSPR
jgi:DNA-binding XRE family transcriptional regulator